MTALVPRYSSFVLRFWRTDSGRRIDVEHIQSGGTLSATTLAAALAWMSALASAPAGTADPAKPEALAAMDAAAAHPGTVEEG